MTFKYFWLFLCFLLANVFDGFLSIYGISNGFMTEINPVIKTLAAILGISVVRMIIVSKIFALIITGWIAFHLPVLIENEENRRRMTVKFWAKQEFSKNFLQTANVLLITLGIIPGTVIHILEILS